MNTSTSHALAGLVAVASLAVAADAHASTAIIDAKNNSLYGDNGVHTGVNLTAGETLKVQVAATDIWSAGEIPRWSTADGLLANLYATGSDESGYAAGTLIGQYLGIMVFEDFWAPVGSLVGKIGSDYKVIGANFDGTAWGTGELRLYFWDNLSVTYDNKDHVTAEITHGFPVEVDVPIDGGAVPEPGVWALMILGFGLTGATLRRRSGLQAQTHGA